MKKIFQMSCTNVFSLLFAYTATTLTGLHFATTTLMTLVMKWLGYIQPSYLPLPELVKFAFFANLSIVGMNVSLMWNSVGFYQVKMVPWYFISIGVNVFINPCLAFSDCEVVYYSSLMHSGNPV